MAEQESGRSELPTPYKLEEARKKGSVVHSADVSSFGVLLGAFVAMLAASTALLAAIRTAFIFCLGPGLGASPLTAAGAVFSTLIDTITPPLLVLTVFAAGAALVQHPLVFSLEPLKPDWKKLNPVEGLKRFFSLKSLFMLGMALLKVVVLSVVTWVIFRNYLVDVIAAIGHPAAMWALLRHMGWALLAVLLLAFGIFAVLDFALNRRLYTRQMMMSPRAIKDEAKRRDGDPLIKRRIREYRMEMLKKIRSLGAVPGSDFVITNPTHYAVAIKYNPRELDAPVVVAKGGGGLAFRIRQIARRHRVPVYERKNLTRALFFATSLGQPVPVEYYSDIAILLKQSRRRRKGH